MNDCRRMDFRRVMRRLMKEFESAGEAQVRVGNAKRSGGNLGETFGNDDGRGSSPSGSGGIFRVRDEGDFLWAGLLDAVETGNFSIGSSILKLGVERRRES